MDSTDCICRVHTMLIRMCWMDFIHLIVPPLLSLYLQPQEVDRCLIILALAHIGRVQGAGIIFVSLRTYHNDIVVLNLVISNGLGIFDIC